MTVQREIIVKQIVNLNTQSKDGQIELFGLLLNRLPVAFWNTVSERLLKAVPADKREEVKAALIDCAVENGYHTGHGILSSPAFKALVGPMVTEGPKDLLRGLFAIFSAAGWAKSGIVQIKEAEKMVIRAVDYFEADGAPGEKRAFMIIGACAAFFDLVYGPPFPDGLGAFQCEQVAGIECGDPFGQFVVTKKE
ncbi:MAG: hypothetical protein V1816_20555 [Pseudomonadota bacterium]